MIPPLSSQHPAPSSAFTTCPNQRTRRRTYRRISGGKRLAMRCRMVGSETATHSCCGFLQRTEMSYRAARECQLRMVLCESFQVLTLSGCIDTLGHGGRTLLPFLMTEHYNHGTFSCTDIFGSCGCLHVMVLTVPLIIICISLISSQITRTQAE